MYRIEYSTAAIKDLRRVPVDVVDRIHARLQVIAADPYGRHPEVTRLQGQDGYRLRVGDWRALYALQDDRLMLLVVKVGSRGDVYR